MSNYITVIDDVEIEDFNFWSGAKDTAEVLTLEQFGTIADYIKEFYPKGINSTELNDLFWFKNDCIAELLGFADWEELESINGGYSKYKISFGSSLVWLLEYELFAFDERELIDNFTELMKKEGYLVNWDTVQAEEVADDEYMILGDGYLIHYGEFNIEVLIQG